MTDFTRDTKNTVEIKSFKPRSLNGEVVNDYKQVKEKFGNLAATDPKSNAHFSLHPDSKKGLGIEAEEKSHLEDLVSIEVESRLELLKEQAYQDGFEKGRDEGALKASAQFFEIVQPQFEQFSALLHSLDQVKNEVYVANEQMLIQMIFQISKHILLDELKVDREYVKRITSQIIEKLGAKENIRLKVNRDDYANLEQLRDFLKTHFPDLKNVQIDPSDDLVLGGVKVETDLSRINASVEAQLKSVQAALSGSDS
jgi:flagellar assembly protein FliH